MGKLILRNLSTITEAVCKSSEPIYQASKTKLTPEELNYVIVRFIDQVQESKFSYFDEPYPVKNNSKDYVSKVFKLLYDSTYDNVLILGRDTEINHFCYWWFQTNHRDDNPLKISPSSHIEDWLYTEFEIEKTGIIFIGG